MATKQKTLAADTKANVTPNDTKATAVETTLDKKVSTTKAVDDETASTKTQVVKPAVKKTTAKKSTTKKTVEKKVTPKKTVSKKTENINASYILQFNGKEIYANNILADVKEAWVNKFQGKLEEITSIEIYIKPEENRAYFVVNGLSNGDYYIEL